MEQKTKLTTLLDVLIGTLFGIYLFAKIGTCLSGCGMEDVPLRVDSGAPDIYLIDLSGPHTDTLIHTCGDNLCELPETIITCPNDCLPKAQKPVVPKIVDPGYVDGI